METSLINFFDCSVKLEMPFLFSLYTSQTLIRNVSVYVSVILLFSKTWIYRIFSNSSLHFYLFIYLFIIYLFIFKKRGFYLLFFHLNHDFYLTAASVRENTVFFNVWIRRKLSKIVTCAEEFVPYCQIRVIKPHGKGLQLWRYSCCV